MNCVCVCTMRPQSGLKSVYCRWVLWMMHEKLIFNLWVDGKKFTWLIKRKKASHRYCCCCCTPHFHNEMLEKLQTPTNRLNDISTFIKTFNILFKINRKDFFSLSTPTIFFPSFFVPIRKMINDVKLIQSRERERERDDTKKLLLL